MPRGLVAVCVCLQKNINIYPHSLLEHQSTTPPPILFYDYFRHTVSFLTTAFPQEYDSDEEEEKERLPPVVS